MLEAHKLREVLKQEIVAQDKAIDAVTRAVIIAEMDICDPNRPEGTFLFLGPTGTGKSQLPRSLAHTLHGSEKEAVTVNCTEFQNPHEVAKLTGAPPGYVGHDQPPLLTPDKLSKKHTVVIFEELEKADRALFNLLLQVLERGELTTGRGVVLNFTRCFIFMTSNIGAKAIHEIVSGVSLGFQPPQGKFEDLTENEADERIKTVGRLAVEDFFSPEFINRIDEIITFSRLKPHHLLSILNKLLVDSQARMAMAGISAVICEEAKLFLIEQGYNLRYGARPLKRAIRKYLEYPLANLAHERKIKERDIVYVSATNDELYFRVEKEWKGKLIYNAAAQ